jgi:hypothetical protein
LVFNLISMMMIIIKKKKENLGREIKRKGDQRE